MRHATRRVRPRKGSDLLDRLAELEDHQRYTQLGRRPKTGSSQQRIRQRRQTSRRKRYSRQLADEEMVIQRQPIVKLEEDRRGRCTGTGVSCSGDKVGHQCTEQRVMSECIREAWRKDHSRSSLRSYKGRTPYHRRSTKDRDGHWQQGYGDASKSPFQ